MRLMMTTWACMIFTSGLGLQGHAGDTEDGKLVEVELRVFSVRTEYLNKLNLNPIPQQPQFDELALPEDNVPEDGIEIVAEAATSKRPPATVLKLDWQNFMTIGRKIQADPQTNVDCSHQISLLDGSGHAETKAELVLRPFVVGLDAAAKPIVEQIDEGLIVKMTGRKLDDGDWLLRSSLRFQDIEEVETTSFGENQVQVPTVNTFTMKTTAKVKPTETLILWGPEVRPAVPSTGWFGKRFKVESYTKLITMTLKTVKSLEPDDLKGLTQSGSR